MPYIELHSTSAFSFLRGASLPEQLAERAAELNMPAMALLDRDGLYGAPRFYAASRERGIRPIIGAELTMEDGTVLPVLVESRTGYRNLSRLITRAKLRGTKTESPVHWNELPEFSEGLVALIDSGFRVSNFDSLSSAFGSENLYIELQRHHLRADDRRNRPLLDFARAHGLPLLATNGVRYAKPCGRQVADVFTCLRHHTHLDAAGKLLGRNSERHLKSTREMASLFRDLPDAIENTKRLADRLQFSLENLGYEFPRYNVPEGETMESFLRKITWAGARARYSHLSAKVHAQIEHELALIGKLGFSGYFLIVWDIVNFCTQSGIMVQGRGSAANSAVCYSLGITPVDPVGSNLLFERFLSEGRKGWPDIDLDLPSGDRREAVIQEVYQHYGKHGAAMTANVITYRGKSAAREIGKCLNFAQDTLDRFSKLFGHGDYPHTIELLDQMEKAGLPRDHARAPAFISLYKSIYGLPRHLGQHSGGMIICQGELSSIVPLENASMPDRVVAQWDKDDCEDLGIIKVDLLGLGMMSVMQDTIELCAERGRPVDLAQIPKDDPATYEIMQKADTIGVFQIESRAQMATLPRMKPRCFYDVVIEVAIIRPGPIQGDMVHPYLARRAGKEPVTYFDDRLKPVLERTLGIPLFQEQLLKMAMVMADFTGSEAEELRRALSFHRSQERMQKVTAKLRAAMEAKGLAPDVIDGIVKSVSSFAVYGFPESHAISFAILAYGSAWLKVHRAPEFIASLLNNQPMGFYASSTLVKDAKRHGVRVRPVCVQKSCWRCTIEPDSSIRLGFCVVNGLSTAHGEQIVQARQERMFDSLDDFRCRTSLNKHELRALATLGALNCFVAHRREALWKAARHEEWEDAETGRQGNWKNAEIPASPCLPFPASSSSALCPLSPMNPMERIQADYHGMDLTTGPHPMALIRHQMDALNVWRAGELANGKNGQRVRIAGNVICRQRPGSARGFVFISLEDETGVANAIIRPPMFEKNRLVISEEAYLLIEGKLQIHEGVIHIQSERIEPLITEHLAAANSHDFH